MFKKTKIVSLSLRKGLAFCFAFLVFLFQGQSNHRNILSVVIKYIDGTTHTSVMQDCTSFWDFPIARDTIILDNQLNSKLEFLLTKSINETQINDDSLDCDIRLTTLVLYTDQTFDMICVSGENFKNACVKVNGVNLGLKPDLVRFLYEIVYDVNSPLHRYLLFGVDDK